MKKFFTNLIAISLTLGVALGATACGIGVVDEGSVDNSKTQLNIASYSGGGGYKWLDDAIKRFEEKYKDFSFEEGKMGVEIHAYHDKLYSQSKTIDDIATSDKDIYFAPASYQQMARGTDMMDITSWITESSTFDSKTIESKMDDSTKEILKVNGNYYGLPYYDFFPGATYDAGLFEEKNLYFSDQTDTDGTKKFVSKTYKTKSCGPDRAFGTYDDGLPSSYQEFYKLLDQMVKMGVIPFAFNGGATHYTNMLMAGLTANLVGVEGMKANVNFDSNGTPVEIVTSFDGNTPVIGNIVLTEENAYLIKQSAGLYYASEFCEKIFSNTQYFDIKSAAETSQNISAMDRFLRSGWDQRISQNYIAMIIEGSYWYNEAISEGVMDTAKKYDPSGNGGVKDLKFMPFPHQYAGTVTPVAEGEQPESQVLLSVSQAYCFARKEMPEERKEVAKLFVQFCYSDEELALAELSNNGVSRSLNYDTTSIQNNLPTYAKSLNEMKDQASKNGTLFITQSQNHIFLKHNEFALAQNDSYWRSSPSGKSAVSTVYDAFFGGKDKLTAKEYFQGLAISESSWRQDYVNS